MTSEALTVDGLAAAYRRPSGPCPTEVVHTILDRIGDVEDRVRAMVTVTDDLALAQAERAAQRLEEGDPSPLVGVPIVLKDLIDVAGVATTAGSEVLRSNVADRDADVWARLEAAGAVLIGKANTHEFAYGGTTEPTRNPWDITRMVGGSSGGPAAALAAGYCAAAIGTDTAGSVRIPAALCGISGLKTTQARYDADGVIPLAGSLDVIGPMAHSPRDCHLVTAAIAGAPPSFDDMVGELQRALGHRTLGIGLVETGSAASAVRERFESAAHGLEGAGARCEPVAIAGLADALAANFTILGAEAIVYHERFRHRRADYTPYVRQRLEEAERTTPEELSTAREHARALRDEIDTAFEHVDLLLGVGVPVTAPIAYVSEVTVDGQSEDRDSMFCRNYAFANLTGHPALSVPAGLVDGLPVGLHLVGPHGADDRVLAAGELITQIFGWSPVLASL